MVLQYKTWMNAKDLWPFGLQYYAGSDGKKVALTAGHRHILGTDDNDYDVFSTLIHGAAYSFSIAIGALALILLLGMSVGGAAAYFGNHKLQASLGEYTGLILGGFPAYFYGIYIRKWGIWQISALPDSLSLPLSLCFSLVVIAVILMLFYYLGKSLHAIPFFRTKRPFPLARILHFCLDLQTAIPVIMLIITLSAVFPKNLYSMMLLIGLAAYTGFARLIRTDLSTLFNLPYMEAAHNAGLPVWRILFKHALPNIAPTLYVLSLLLFADIILFEASLSFLGIGITPENHSSWGLLLAQSRNYPQAWWLTVFPTLVIFLTTLSLHTLANKFRK